MFINFWYVAAESKTVNEAPVLTRMLGQDFVLFRDQAGQVHCLSNVCVHRGGSLAHGKIKGDCVECPYHGWQFDGAGQCTRIPSMGPDAKVPARAKVDSYPTQERYGLIFAFLGDACEAERIPILDMPEWTDSEWRWTFVTCDWKFNYQRATENLLDPAHTEFVHPMFGFEGEKDDYRLPELKMLESEWGTGHETFVPSSIKEGSLKAEMEGGKFETYTQSGHHGPCQAWIYIHFTPEAWTHQYAFVTPLDEFHSRRYFFSARKNFATGEENDERVHKITWKTMEEDRVVVELLRPTIAPEVNTKEVLVPSDTIIVRFREKLKEWEARGWRIDSDTVDREKARAAYAIPSPARTLSKGWALESVPRLAAAEGQTKRAAQ